MSRCMNTESFLYFLETINVDLTATAGGIIVHATAGDVLWRWTGLMWCW